MRSEEQRCGRVVWMSRLMREESSIIWWTEKPMQPSSSDLTPFEKRTAFAWSRRHLENWTDRSRIRWRWNDTALIAPCVKNFLDLFGVWTRKLSSNNWGTACRGNDSRDLLYAERMWKQTKGNVEAARWTGCVGRFALPERQICRSTCQS